MSRLFRKRPVVVEAFQFARDIAPWPEGVVTVAGGGCTGHCGPLSNLPHVHTLEGPLRVSDGDWIITGVRGERYPCKPDIFAATYEPAPDRDGGRP